MSTLLVLTRQSLVGNAAISPHATLTVEVSYCIIWWFLGHECQFDKVICFVSQNEKNSIFILNRGFWDWPITKLRSNATILRGWLTFQFSAGEGGIDRVKKGVAWWVRDRSAFWCRGGREEGEVDSCSAKKVCQSAIVSYLKLSLKGCGTLSFKFYRKFIKGSVKLDYTSRFTFIGITWNLQLIKGAYI